MDALKMLSYVLTEFNLTCIKYLDYWAHSYIPNYFSCNY